MQKAIVAKVGDYQIRRCEREDIPSVIDINAEALPEHYSDYFYYEILAEFPETFLVAELDGALIGYVMCRIEYGFSHLRRLGLARKGHIVSVAVREQHRSKGVGTMLMRASQEAMVQKTATECVRGDVLILGDNKPISELAPGDGVLGFSGLNSVKGAASRSFNGDLIRIIANGMLPLETTPEHPLLVSRSRTDHHDEVSGFGPLFWEPAQSAMPKLSRRDGDYLVLPRLRPTIAKTNLDLKSFTDPRGIWTAQSKGVPLSFPLNEKTAWLLGIYVAEGSPHRTEVQFSFGKDEEDLQQRVVRIGAELGYSPTVHEKRTVTRVTIYSSILARAFPSWCGKGALHKRVPEFILLHRSLPLLRAFIRGWEEGDGSRTKDHKTDIFVGNTESRVLALQLQLGYARLGTFAALAEKRHKPGYKILGRSVKNHNFYDLRYPLFPNKTKAKARIFSDHLLVPVHRVSRVPYTGRVYNIETTDSTYLVSNLVIHNCYLEVRVSNADAIALYQRLGYRVSGRLEAYYKDGEAALVMAIQIGQ